jgi:PAS domain S-box-containing protein
LRHKSKPNIKHYLLLPIFGVLLSVLSIGFGFSIHVAYEYEKHNQQVKTVETLSALVAVARHHHQSLFSDQRITPGWSRLDEKGSLLVELISALTVEMDKVLIAVAYRDGTKIFSRGHSDDDVRLFANTVNNDGLETAGKIHGIGNDFVEMVQFISDPPGQILIISSARSGPFIVDFVFYKLWMFLVVAVLVSIAIALMAYRFVRNRYDEVSHERTRLRDFATSSSDWFWEMDENLRFSYFSSRFTDVTGVPMSMLLGVTREENGNPGASREVWSKHLADLHGHRAFRNFIHPRVKPDGSIVWLSINGAPVFENGRFSGYRGTGTEITRQREMENQLIELKEEAERANKAKSEFLANMSHELRTPLNAICGYSEALERETFGSLGNRKNNDAVALINQAGTHLMELINDILDISRIEAGSMEIQDEELDLSELVEEATTMVQRNALEHHLTLVTEVPDVLPLIRADQLRVKQILLNLLSNAIKFTPHGGQISVVCEADIAEGVTIRVTDTGIGIRKDDIPSIMEPFGQVADALNRNHGGTGLGLPICASLMELHNGTLTIESTKDIGTSVSAKFPSERVLWEEVRIASL